MPGRSDHLVNSGMKKFKKNGEERRGKCASKSCGDLSCPEYSGNLQDFCLYLSDCII